MPSKWTRKVAAPVVAVATAALLATGAAPASASSGGLTVKVARHLARKLEAKQRRERSLRFTELGDPHRRSSSRIDFPYHDRSTDDVLCSATIVVVQSGDSRNAEMRSVSCHGIPSEILSYEQVTRHMRHAVRKRASDVQRSTRDFSRSLDACNDVVVPRKHRDDVDVLFFLGGVRAFYTPIRSPLNDFDDALHAVHGEDPRVTRGVDAWDRTLVLLDEMPAAAADPCPAVREWAKHHFSDASAPADFGKARVVRHQLNVQSKILREVAKHLREEGVAPAIARAFAPAGLFKLLGV